MEKKKSAVDLTDLAIGIIILGIVVTIGVTILLNVRDARLTDLPTVTTTNESISPTDTGAALTDVWVSGVTQCENASNIGVISTGNYTVSITNGVATITNLTDEFSLYPWNCTYNWYNTSREDWALPNNASLGLAEFGNWFDIIVIVGVAAVILALIFMAFGNRDIGQSGGGVAY